jgi:hypothetical protein
MSVKLGLSLSPREDRRLLLFENRELRIFGTKREHIAT